MFNFLQEILERKQKEVEQLALPVRFSEALTSKPLSVIAEIKRKSPSKGILNAAIDPVELARKYVAGGASAISVLTDEGFGGTLQDLKDVIAACPNTPILRKDFIIDLRQIDETARAGAHAVLLIAAVLKERLPEFIKAVEERGMDALVEVHSLDELISAQQSGAKIIGVNNRNLTTFHVNLQTAEDLSSHFLPRTIKVAESGIENAEDASRMKACGYDAILVGEALVKCADPQHLIEEMRHAH